MPSYSSNLAIPMLGSQPYASIHEDDEYEGCLGCCSGKDKRTRLDRAHQQPVNLNLVIDPAFFNRMPQAKESMSLPSTNTKRARRKKPKAVSGDSSSDESDASEASSFAIPLDPDAGLANQLSLHTSDKLEQMYKDKQVRWGRRKLKQRAIFDGVFSLLWLSEAIWAIGFGERCPPGGFAGW